MNFVFPQFLWALTTLTLPILVHLFNFRRTTRIFFSDTRFLNQIKKKTSYKNKLKRYLILLARMLFLFFLVVAFAKPFIPAREHTINTQRIIFYLDNSLSMSAPTPSTTRAIDSGMGFIRKMIKSLPATARYKLVTNDFAPFSNAFKSADQILDMLTQIRLSATSRTATEIIRRIGADAKGADIFWVSDFQKSTFGQGDLLTANEGTQWHPVPVTIAQYANLYVDSVYLENPFSIEGGVSIVKVRIANANRQEVDSVIVKLIINDIQSGIASLHIASDEFGKVNFELPTDLDGLNRAQIHIGDFFVGFDNDFYFTINFTEKIRIAEIKNEPVNEYIKDVFGNPKIFTHAGFLADNVDYDELKKADLVVLNGLQTLDNPLIAALRAAMDKNAVTVLLIPGEKPDLVAYGKLLQTKSLKRVANNKTSTLDKPDIQDPFFSGVFEKQTHPLKMPHAIPVIDWEAYQTAPLKFKDTRPFLSQRDNFFLLASPLNKEYTDFCYHALFVPVMYKVATSAKSTGQRMYYTLSDNLITIKTNNTISNTPIKLLGEQEIIPIQRRVGEKLLLEIPKFLMHPGFYYATHQQDTLDIIAINPDKRESDLRPLATKEIAFLYGDSSKAPILQTANTKISINDIKERYLGKPLWKIALLLALLCLLAEILLIRYLR